MQAAKPKSDVVWRQSAEEATLAAKPRHKRVRLRARRSWFGEVQPSASQAGLAATDATKRSLSGLLPFFGARARRGCRASTACRKNGAGLRRVWPGPVSAYNESITHCGSGLKTWSSWHRGRPPVRAPSGRRSAAVAYYFDEPSRTFNEYLLVPGHTPADCIPARVNLRPRWRSTARARRSLPRFPCRWFRHHGRRVRRQDGRGAHRGRFVVHLRQPIHRGRGRHVARVKD